MVATTKKAPKTRTKRAQAALAVDNAIPEKPVAFQYGDRVKGKTLEGTWEIGFITSLGRTFAKLDNGRCHITLEGSERLGRDELPVDLLHIVGLSWASQLDRLFEEFCIYNLGSWQGAKRSEQIFERYKGWEISFYNASEVDLFRNDCTWYFELKRFPEIKGNGDISDYCRKAIDCVESRLAELEAVLNPPQPELPPAPTCDSCQHQSRYQGAGEDEVFDCKLDHVRAVFCGGVVARTMPDACKAFEAETIDSDNKQAAVIESAPESITAESLDAGGFQIDGQIATTIAAEPQQGDWLTGLTLVEKAEVSGQFVRTTSSGCYLLDTGEARSDGKPSWKTIDAATARKSLPPTDPLADLDAQLDRLISPPTPHSPLPTHLPAVLPLAQIRRDGGTQRRTGLNEDHVRDLTDALDRGETLPRVKIIWDGASAWLWDGFHRIEAYGRRNVESIEVEAEFGTLRDAVLKSASANAAHGLRRTNEDKRRSVFLLLHDEEWSQWSDRRIANLCGVSNRFVSNLRGELKTAAKSAEADGVSVNGSQFTVEQEVFLHKAPGTIKRLKEGAALVHFADGLKDWISFDRLSLAPFEVDRFQSCELCQFCEARDDSSYCQKFDEFVTSDRAQTCEKYALPSRAPKPREQSASVNRSHPTPLKPPSPPQPPQPLTQNSVAWFTRISAAIGKLARLNDWEVSEERMNAIVDKLMNVLVNELSEECDRG